MWILLCGLLVIFFDQVSKYWVVRNNLPVVHNTGGAWGIGQNVEVYTIVVCIMLVGLLWYIVQKKIYQQPLINQLLWGLLIGGGIGNLIDRIRLGYVIDWISVGNWFPWFNLADVSICVGVGLWLWEQVGIAQKEKKNL